MSNIPEIPRGRFLYEDVLRAIESLGGSAKVREIPDKVVELKGWPKEILDVQRNGGRGALAYEIAWALSLMIKCDAVENTSRGTWAITSEGRRLLELGQDQIYQAVEEGWVRFYAERAEDKPETGPLPIREDGESQTAEEVDDWKADLLITLQSLPAKSFERLAQRILRESNFQNVEVIGRAGDGGLDGIGMLKIALLTFRVYFQCKRYKQGNTVGPDAIRDFRGALQGRAEKGLFLTTSRFTAEARREASREGAIAIDLIDGEELCDLLKDLKLGVDVELVEQPRIRHSWFVEFE